METTTPTEESPKERGVRRLLSTVTLLRSGARDADEATVYLNEEKRLQRLLTRMHPSTANAA